MLLYIGFFFRWLLSYNLCGTIMWIFHLQTSMNIYLWQEGCFYDTFCSFFSIGIFQCLNLTCIIHFFHYIKLDHTHALYFINNVFYGNNFSAHLFGMSSLVSCMIFCHITSTFLLHSLSWKLKNLSFQNKISLSIFILPP